MLVFSQAGINSDCSLPDASAMLDVKSTTKGIPVTRMTVTQRNTISVPAIELLIYCIDNNRFHYNSGTLSSPARIILDTKLTIS
jgi:hypothetical protein